MVAPKEGPNPDYSNAYIFFQQAYEVDPKNQVATAARDEVLKKIDKLSKRATLDAKIAGHEEGLPGAHGERKRRSVPKRQPQLRLPHLSPSPWWSPLLAPSRRLPKSRRDIRLI